MKSIVKPSHSPISSIYITNKSIELKICRFGITTSPHPNHPLVKQQRAQVLPMVRAALHEFEFEFREFKFHVQPEFTFADTMVDR
jgi:hypothetical protein